MLTPLGAMRLAIDEAQKGLGFVSPNPPVGCVILDKDGNFLVKGYHRKFGGDHAEIDALKQVKNQGALKGATLYVTLEPCAHIGKTPACAVALAKLPIAKVVYGLQDPNPLVAGKGLEILKAAGIVVETLPELHGDLEDLAEVFLFNQREKNAFVTLKIATTLDGQMAHISGESQWLTGEESREHAQYLRGIHDAVMIGAETFRKDKPKLNVRHQRFLNKENTVIIVNGSGDCLSEVENSEVYSCHSPERIVVAIDEAHRPKLRNFPFQVWAMPATKGNIDLGSLLAKAFDSQLHSVFVEGGPRLISDFLVQRRAHRLCQFIAPQLLGQKSGKSFTGQAFEVPSFSDRIVLSRPSWTVLGRDALFSGRL